MKNRVKVLLPWVVVACGGPAVQLPPQTDPLGPPADDPVWEQVDDSKVDSSATSVVRQIDWDAFVYVPADADTATVQRVIRAQVKSALGSLLHWPGMSLRDRGARSNVDPSNFKRTPLQVVAADGKTIVANVERVAYHYRDRALVARSFKKTDFAFVVFFGDYVARAEELRAACADDTDVEPDSLWFDFDPSNPPCKALQKTELDALNAAARSVASPATQISQTDYDRRFLTVRARLVPVAAVRTVYPEYDRLWGFGTDRTKLVSYAFFGVDDDSANPRDTGLVEYARMLRSLRKAAPGLAVVETRPFAMLLDFTVAGTHLAGVTYEDLANWLVDGKGWPRAVGVDRARREDLLRQARDKLLERWIVWQTPATATWKGQKRSMTLEIRTYYGNEDGRWDWRDAARNRYLEAFWHADIFSYSGHSHFGHGPLEPVDYGARNFPDRYQTFFFDSCVSYNYYDVDFLEMHPGGSRNLDVVVNGLPAAWTRAGQVTASYILGAAGVGGSRSWTDVLKTMQVSGSDPMRAVTGEEDNVFNPAGGVVDVKL